MHAVGFLHKRTAANAAIKTEAPMSWKNAAELEFANKSLPKLKEILEDFLKKGLNDPISDFTPENIMQSAQRDILGYRGLKEIDLNGKYLIKEGSHDLGTEINGLYITYTEVSASGKLLPKIRSSVSLYRKYIESEAGRRIQITFDKFAFPANITDVCVNGFSLPDCRNGSQLEDFLSDEVHFQRVMGSVVATRILNGAFPDSTIYQKGGDLLHKMLAENPDAAAIFLQRTRLIEQRMGNAVTQALALPQNPEDNISFHWSMENEHYSIMVEKSPDAANALEYPINSPQFTEMIRNFKISLSLSCEPKAMSSDPMVLEKQSMPEWHKTGTMRYTFEITAEGIPFITEISILDSEGSLKKYTPYKQSEDAPRAASEHCGFRARVKRAIGRSAS